jgi:hypothetical protein
MFTVRSFDPKPLIWWYGERDQIETDPPYQRKGRLWSAEDKAFLIDSILNGFDVPKLYIADFTYVNTPLNLSRKPFAVIDGKQRLEAIFDFFDGKLALGADFEYFEDRGLRLGGLSYRDLREQHPKVLSKFEYFIPSVVSVITDDESQINELFVRLNRSKPLTGSEIRNAMRGTVPELIRVISQHEFFRTRVRFQVVRGQDLNAAAKMLLVEFRGRLVDTKKKQLDNLVVETATQAETDSVDRAVSRVMGVLDGMSAVFLERDTLLGAEGRVLLYYWFVRNVHPPFRGAIREFLLMFERTLHESRALGSKGVYDVDEELLNFGLLARSTNDAGSLSARYATLVRRFAAHLGMSTSEVVRE